MGYYHFGYVPTGFGAVATSPEKAEVLSLLAAEVGKLPGGAEANAALTAATSGDLNLYVQKMQSVAGAPNAMEGARRLADVASQLGTAAGVPSGQVLGTAIGAVNLLATVFSNAPQGDGGPVVLAENVVSYALTGASMGMAFGGIGAGVGAAIGAVAGLIGTLGVRNRAVDPPRDIHPEGRDALLEELKRKRFAFSRMLSIDELVKEAEKNVDDVREKWGDTSGTPGVKDGWFCQTRQFVGSGGASSLYSVCWMLPPCHRLLLERSIRLQDKLGQGCLWVDYFEDDPNKPIHNWNCSGQVARDLCADEFAGRMTAAVASLALLRQAKRALAGPSLQFFTAEANLKRVQSAFDAGIFVGADTDTYNAADGLRRTSQLTHGELLLDKEGNPAKYQTCAKGYYWGPIPMPGGCKQFKGGTAGGKVWRPARPTKSLGPIVAYIAKPGMRAAAAAAAQQAEETTKTVAVVKGAAVGAGALALLRLLLFL